MNKEKFPRVLIISHNALSKVNNMGKTIASYFSLFPQNCIAQLYLHEGMPETNICNNYFSFTDKDALKSVLFRFYRGNIYRNQNFENNKYDTDNGFLYRLSTKYNPLIYLCRDIMWGVSNVYNKKLINWIKEFNPDIIFFASGELSFSYKIALKISKKLNIPLATCCFDDFYFQCQYRNKLFGKFYYKRFKKIFRKTIEYSNCHFAVNDFMAVEYSNHFNKEFHTLYTSCNKNFTIVPYDLKSGISYIGGLSLGRLEELLKLGNKLSVLDNEKINKIHIYSFVNDSNIIKKLNESRGIVFHGSILANEVIDVINNSLACFHVESFEEEYLNRVKYSLSTKISDVIGSNTILIAYGPNNIASTKYLINNNVGIYSNDIDDLIEKIKNNILDEKKYYDIISASNKIAKENHDLNKISEKFVKVIVNNIKKI